MEPLETRLAALLDEAAPRSPDRSFTLAVMARIERRQYHGRMLKIALASSLGALALTLVMAAARNFGPAHFSIGDLAACMLIAGALYLRALLLPARY